MEGIVKEKKNKNLNVVDVLVVGQLRQRGHQSFQEAIY
jgi:hypothetical protein